MRGVLYGGGGVVASIAGVRDVLYGRANEELTRKCFLPSDSTNGSNFRPPSRRNRQ